MRNLERFAHRLEIDFVAQLPPVWRERILERFEVLSEPAQEVRFSRYMPVLPVAITLAYVQGLPLALISCSAFLLMGFLGPNQGLYLFAGGPGGSYWREPGFGYLLGIMAGAWFSAWISQGEERKSWRQLLSALGGIGIIHIAGLATMVAISFCVLLFEGESAFLQFRPWLGEQIRNLSWYALPYDALFATILVGLSFPLRWLFSALTSPDIAHKHRPSVGAQLDELQETLA